MGQAAQARGDAQCPWSDCRPLSSDNPPFCAAACVCVSTSRVSSTPTALQPLHFDYLAASPTAVASFLHSRYLVNGKLAPGTPPGARAVAPGQVFDLTLTLVRAPSCCCASVATRSNSRSLHSPSLQELPECPVNRDLGVFQITAALLTSSGQEVALSSRAAQLRYRSLVTRALRTALWAPLLALDMRREVQTVTVSLFEGEWCRTPRERWRHCDSQVHLPL